MMRPTLAASLVLAACADEPSSPTHHGLAVFEDLDPDPDVVEVELRAGHTHGWELGDGTSPHALAYNGANPGPLLEAELGDRIVVHFENDLDWPTTVHWHGLRVPAAMDGSLLTQEPIPPGGRFDYAFEARDVGLYWYHPHMHESVQVELGLYGPIVIHAPDEPELALDVPLVVDDLLLGEDGEIVGLDPHAGMPHDDNPDPDNEERLGNVVLVNGRRTPTIPVTRGGWALFRLLNTSDARHVQLALEDHDLLVVGLDGGFLANPYAADALVLGVGERYLVLVELDGERGRAYAWTHRKYAAEDPFIDDPLEAGPIAIATLAYGDDELPASPRPRFPAADAPDLGHGGEVNHRWTLGETFVGGTFVDTIDGEIWPDIPVQRYAANGDYTFEIEGADDPHPFHLHGNSFQVVAVDGVAVDLRAWKDTVTVAPDTTVRLRARLDNPGRWMYHCHILDHHEDGMMAELVVE